MVEDTLIIPSKKSIRRAGDTLKDEASSTEQFREAMSVLSQWRKLHFYPINTFQAYLRTRVKTEYPNIIIAQRLKRVPSIIEKLRRFPQMNLDRMQDICGFRVILKDIKQVYSLHGKFEKSKSFRHELILPPKDYIKEPKKDGYRSLHQVFKYHNKNHPELNDLRIELQLRTELQHAWATAVETLGIVEQSSFKTGQGGEKFKEFFRLSSQLFAMHERRNGDAQVEYKAFLQRLNELEKELYISQKLSGLAISANHIDIASKESTGYHLMELNLKTNSISLTHFTEKQKEKAESFYSMEEEKTRNNPELSVVLISAGNLTQIKKAYPNYFLDTKKFISQFNTIKTNFEKKYL